MIRSFLLILGLGVSAALFAQKNTSGTDLVLHEMEQRMAGYADDILNAQETAKRAVADSFFTRALVQALKVPYSFSYPFDSLKTISRLYAPDSSFRIITWQVMKDYSYYRQKGAIQYRTKDGSLKLTPLYDYSPFTETPTDSVRTNKEWIGAVYYAIIQKTFNGKNYYTLFGYDENDARSTKKWLEVLTFDENNQPVFGGRYFNYPADETKPPQPAYRFCLEFKKNASAHLNYDKEMDLITFSRLTSESGEPGNHYTLIPTGSFEGFRWMNGKWVYIPVIKEVDPKGTLNPTKEAMEQKRNQFVVPRKGRGNN